MKTSAQHQTRKSRIDSLPQVFRDIAGALARFLPRTGPISYNSGPARMENACRITMRGMDDHAWYRGTSIAPGYRADGGGAVTAAARAAMKIRYCSPATRHHHAG